MKAEALKGVIFDSVCIYKEDENGSFIELYNGTIQEAPDNIIGLKIRTVGASKSMGVMDIEVDIRL